MSENATELNFGVTTIPRDDTPSPEPDNAGPFDPRYPDSTPEAPYGYKPDGTPYKRHHGGRSGGTASSGRGAPAKARDAESAAWLLSRMNSFIGLALTVAGMPESAATLAANNEDFRRQAEDALLTDPVLCRKILSAGATSGKAGLAMAYVMLGVSTFPDMKREYRQNHPKEIEGAEYDENA